MGFAAYFNIFFLIVNSSTLSFADNFQLLVSKSKAKHSINGQFEQTKWLKKLDIKLRSSGKFLISNQGQETIIFWNVLKPEKMNICLDSKKILLLSADKASQQIIQTDGLSEDLNKQFKMLLKLLDLDLEFIDANFSVSEVSKSEFLFTAKENKAFLFKSVNLNLTEQGLIKHILIKEKSDDEIEINFDKMRINIEKSSRPCS